MHIPGRHISIFFGFGGKQRRFIRQTRAGSQEMFQWKESRTKHQFRRNHEKPSKNR
jgi:hypothetical protein